MMNATPLQALMGGAGGGQPPRPEMQSNKGRPEVQPLSYEQLSAQARDEVAQVAHGRMPGGGGYQGMQGGGGGGMMPGGGGGGMMPGMGEEVAMLDPSQFVQHRHHHGHGGHGHGHRHAQHRPHRHRGRGGRGASSTRRGIVGNALAKLRAHKSSILVALVVFAVLAWVAPRLAAAVPRTISPATGTFNTLGLSALAAMCGGIHVVADTYVLPKA